MRNRLAPLVLLGLLAAPAWSEPKTYAVLVGIDHFQHPSLPTSRYSVSDARLVAQALQDVCHVPKENIFLMTSDSPDEACLPTLANMAYRLGWLGEKLSKDDTFLFYYAGASQSLEKQSYLLTSEADPRSAATLKLSALRCADLTDLLKAHPCKQTLVIFDSFRAGAGLDPQLAQFIPEPRIQGHSAAYFACDVGERSLDWDEKRHGAFAYFLVNGLRQQGADREGRVSLQGLSDYVNPGVAGQVKSQHPVLRYAGSQPSQWVLAQVKPGKADDAPKFMAELEAARARLDIETARRKAAEVRAQREESRRREVEQSLAILERQLGGKLGAPAAPSATSSDLEREAARLRAENDQLKARLQASGARGLSFDNWDAGVKARKAVDAGGAIPAGALSLDGATPKLKLEKWMRDILVAQMAQVEKSYGADWAQGSQSELGFLKDQLSVQRGATQLYSTRHQLAEAALVGSTQRLAEAEARIQASEALIKDLNAKLEDNKRKIAECQSRQAEAEKSARAYQQRAVELEKRLSDFADSMSSKYKGTPVARDWIRRARATDLIGPGPVIGPEAQDFGP